MWGSQKLGRILEDFKIGQLHSPSLVKIIDSHIMIKTTNQRMLFSAKKHQ